MSLILEYDTRNCPFCGVAVLGKWLANCSLPIGEKIMLVDRFSSDPKLGILKAIKKEYGGIYPLPCFLILDKKGSSIILSVLDSSHLKAFFKCLKDII